MTKRRGQTPHRGRFARALAIAAAIAIYPVLSGFDLSHHVVPPGEIRDGGPAKDAIPAVFLCYAIRLAINAGYVLTTPGTSIGHPGYFDHKQELGQFAAISIILSSYEVLRRDWRSLVAVVAIGVGFWLVFGLRGFKGSRVHLAPPRLLTSCLFRIHQCPLIPRTEVTLSGRTYW